MKPTPIKCKVPKVPFGQKLKNAPLELRSLLRLVALAERRTNQADLVTLADELGASPDELPMVMISLLRTGNITMQPLSPTTFEFTIHPDAHKALVKPARSYRVHLEAKARRALRAIKNAATASLRSAPGPKPAYLTDITAEQRASHLEAALALATELGRPEFAEKVANCIVRIGPEEVSKLVDEVLATHKNGDGSLRRRFFYLYEKRRDELIGPLVKS